MQAILQQSVSLHQLELLVVDLPQKMQFRSAIGTRNSRKALIIKWIDKDAAVGYGEASFRPDPYYSSEFLKAALLLIQDFIFPLIQQAGSYAAILQAMDKVRGWPFTKAAVEFALNDLLLRKTGQDLLSASGLEQLEKVPVGISLGLQADANALKKAVDQALLAGYHRLKFKINPQAAAKDFDWIREQHPDLYLSFDANGSFGEHDLDRLADFTELDCMVEQPIAPGRQDLALLARQQLPQLFTCLDESIKGLGDLVAAQRLNLLDELNLKPGRTGGLYNSLQIIQYCQQNQLPCWIGGMFETGIGRSANLRVAACLPKAKAHDLSPSLRYFNEDLIQQPIEMDADGFVYINNQAPEIHQELLEKYTIQKITLPKK